MEIRLKKQPQKYLESVDENTRQKLFKALEQLSRLEGVSYHWRGKRIYTGTRLPIIE